MTRLELRECWAAKLHGFDPAAESFAAFCRTHELHYPNALAWRRKLHIGNSPEKLDFVEIAFPSSDSVDFILRRNGWEILIPGRFEDQTLRRILAIFEGA